MRWADNKVGRGEKREDWLQRTQGGRGRKEIKGAGGGLGDGAGHVGGAFEQAEDLLGALSVDVDGHDGGLFEDLGADEFGRLGGEVGVFD